MCPAVACEMLVSHSPPVFSHSPPMGFLSQYASLCLNSELPRTCRATTPPTTSYRPSPLLSTLPKKPCLRPSSNRESIAHLKKNVAFADDKGMSLTQVRIMSEPSNMPPSWSQKFLAEVTHGLSAEPEVAEEPWTITFPQPAADYIEFRKKLETKKVSLENVIVKENEDAVVGTVKVGNLSYKKEVIIRTSFDSWGTHEDVPCVFLPSASSTSANRAYVLYDTFSFNISLPAKVRKVEFCVCFRCDGREYWDNNDDDNYIIMKRTTGSIDKTVRNKYMPAQTPKYFDAVQAKLDSWSEFASWNHLENSAPYW